MSHGPGRLQFALLDALFARKPDWTAPVAEIREALGVSTAAMARTMRGLEVRGFIARGGRPRVATLTRQGLHYRNVRAARNRLPLTAIYSVREHVECP